MAKEWVVLYQNGIMDRYEGKPMYDQMVHALSELGVSLERVPEFKKFEGVPCDAYADENGKLKNLEVNEIATGLWHDQLRATGRPFNPDLLVGPIIIVKKR